jgi:hypothetical protein
VERRALLSNKRADSAAQEAHCIFFVESENKCTSCTYDYILKMCKNDFFVLRQSLALLPRLFANSWA